MDMAIARQFEHYQYYHYYEQNIQNYQNVTVIPQKIVNIIVYLLNLGRLGSPCGSGCSSLAAFNHKQHGYKHINFKLII